MFIAKGKFFLNPYYGVFFFQFETTTIEMKMHKISKNIKNWSDDDDMKKLVD